MSRLLVLFIVGVTFGAVVRALRLTGVLVEDGAYLSALVFVIGVAAALAAIYLADHVQDHRTSLHPR